MNKSMISEEQRLYSANIDHSIKIHVGRNGRQIIHLLRLAEYGESQAPMLRSLKLLLDPVSIFANYNLKLITIKTILEGEMNSGSTKSYENGLTYD